MLLTRLKRLFVLTVVLVTLSAVAGISAASAHQADSAPAVAGQSARAEQDRSARAPIAPTCVERFYHNHVVYKEVHMANWCAGTTRYVKVIVAFGPDSGCIRLVRGASATHRWPPLLGSRFDRLEVC
jgi:hypothetical protein